MHLLFELLFLGTSLNYHQSIYKGFEVFIEDYLQSSLEEIDKKFKNIPILDDDI